MPTAVADPSKIASEHVRNLFVAAFKAQYKLANGKDTDWGDRHMPAWDGGYDGVKECKPCWPKIAKICVENQFDPAAYIAAQFQGQVGRLTPNLCVGQRAINCYLEYAADSDSKLRFAFTAQHLALRTESVCRIASRKLSPRDAVESVLKDQNIQLSGLFRYGLAVAYCYPDVAARFRTAAMFQYMFRRDAYDEAWAKLPIPDGFRAAVEAAFLQGDRGDE